MIRLLAATVLVVVSVIYLGYALGNPLAARDTGLPAAYIALLVSLFVAGRSRRNRGRQGPRGPVGPRGPRGARGPRGF